MSRKTFIIDSVLKTNTWTRKFKYLREEKIIESFYEKELLLTISWMSYYPQPNSHNRDKIKIVLNLSNYIYKKVLAW